MSENQLLFQVHTPLAFLVGVTVARWELISDAKHPAMAGRESDVKNTLQKPDEIRQSRKDPNVYLFYRQEHRKRWLCAVVKRLEGEGFLITAYPTDAVKEGTVIWSR